MNRIYRCPVCTKASYSYGTCSDECESKLAKMHEKENAFPDIFTKAYGIQSENELLKIRISELEKERREITAAHEAFLDDLKVKFLHGQKDWLINREHHWDLISINDLKDIYNKHFQFIHLAEQVRLAKLSAGVDGE